MLQPCSPLKAGVRYAHGYVLRHVCHSGIFSKIDHSKITGWSNFLGLVTGPCSVNYALAYMMLTAAVISNPEYVVETWHLYLLMLALLILEGFLTMNSTKFLGNVNAVGTVINVIVVLIFLVWFPVGSINSPKTNDDNFVWKQVTNGTEWPTGFSFLMGFLSVIWTMS